VLTAQNKKERVNMSNTLELMPGQGGQTEEPLKLLRVLDTWRDGFGNKDRLLWDPIDNTIHLQIKDPEDPSKKLDIEIPPDRVLDAHTHMPLMQKGE
jgi:hypothetical protein